KIVRLVLLGRPPDRPQQMRMAENASTVLGKLGKNGELLRCQADLLSILGDLAMEEIDDHAACLDRLLVPVLAQFEQVGDVAIELQRLVADRRDELPVAGAAAP